MPALDQCHWKVDAGEGTWNQLSALIGQPVGALLKANDLADTTANRSASPRVGRVIHLPFVG